MTLDAAEKLLRDKLDYIDRTIQAGPDTPGTGGEWGLTGRRCGWCVQFWKG